MTDIRTFLADLQRQGIKLVLDGDVLRSRSAPGAITPEIGAAIRTNKSAIVGFLRDRQVDHRNDLWPVDRAQPLVVSSAQRRLWLTCQKEGGLPYINSSSFRITGQLDVLALQTALAGLVERHEPLRTAFAEHDGDLIQVIATAAPLPLDQYDLRDLPMEVREEEVRRIVGICARTDFDLERDMMIRATLIRTDAAEHVLCLTVHHIAFDSWSLDILMRDLSVLYAAALDATAPSLAPLPIQYVDYAAWQQAQLRQGRMQAKLDYWRQALDDLPLVHGIPLDHPRPPVKGHAAARVRQTVPTPILERLRRLAGRHEATVFMLLQGALAWTIGRWSYSDDVAIGVPTSGRVHEKLTNLVGFFVNTLVLRTRLEAVATVADLIRESRSVCLAAFENDAVPFDRVVELIQPERSSAFTPLFQILFTHVSQGPARADMGGLGIELLPRREIATGYDLDILATETAEGLVLTWDHDHSLFDTATIQRLSDSFGLLLAQIDALGAEADIRSFDIVPTSDRTRQAAWNATVRSYPKDACIHSLVADQAARSPQVTALVCGDKALTYSQVDGKANALARRLIAAGVTHGSFVPVLMQPGLAVPIAFLGIMKAGAAFAPLDPAWPANRTSAAIASLGATVVLSDGRTGDPVRPEDCPLIMVDVDSLPLENDPAVPTSSTSPIYVMHTSGSTGVPKGAVNIHRGIVNRLFFMNRYFGNGTDEVVLQTTNHCFDSAVWQFFWPLIKGGTCIIPNFTDGFDLDEIISLVETHGVTLTDFTPALLSVFSDRLEMMPGTATGWRLRHIIAGGEEMTPSVAAKSRTVLPGVALHNFYGPSETSIGTICCQLPQRIDRTIPIGRPIDNVAVAIVDRSLTLLPSGAAGELVLGGDCVGLGYVGREEETRQAFVADLVPYAAGPAYRTGDLARYRPDGMIEFLGRIDNQVKIRGFRVELGEIQAALEAQPGVRQAYVQTVGEERARRIAAYLVLEDTGQDTAQAVEKIRAGVVQRLPDYMVPGGFAVIDRIPVSASGKVDRRALPDPAGLESKGRIVAPADELERQLSAIWARALGMRAEDLSVTANFFEIGGNSLMSISVRAAIERELSYPVSIADLFRHPTIRALAAALTGSAVPPPDRSAITRAAKARILDARRKTGSDT